VRSQRNSSDTWWALGWLSMIIAVAALLVVALWGPLHLAESGTNHLPAVLAVIGVLITAAVSIVGLTLTRQSNRRLSEESREAASRLRLDAAMRAGASFSSPNADSVAPSSIASSLLALTKLDNADLSVALLVDFWSPGATSRVSDETAILVVDSALRSGKPAAQLVAAELLCRNAGHLDACQSLHWPSYVDGCWDPAFGPKTKLLLVDALVLMALASTPATEGALRSAAVRLYGIFARDPDKNVRGCVATLIDALLPALQQLGYKDFMQGNRKVMLAELESAAKHARRNDDDFLARIVEKRSDALRAWAEPCTSENMELAPGALALATTNPTPGRTAPTAIRKDTDASASKDLASTASNGIAASSHSWVRSLTGTSIARAVRSHVRR
jgi:hypothetical protein